MRLSRKRWSIPLLLYGLFFIWYTDFGGPLTEDEIATFETTMVDLGYDPERVPYLTAFFREDTGNQFLMVNVIDANQNPPEVAGAPPGADADTLMGLYMEHMIPQLLSRACHPTFVGNAVFSAIDVVGIDDAENWSDAALMRYRSRRALMEIITHPAMRERHDFKIAALEKTIAYPVEPVFYLADLRLQLGLLLLIFTLLLDKWLGRKPAP